MSGLYNRSLKEIKDAEEKAREDYNRALIEK